MEFFVAILFLLFYYLRPQDWVAGLAGANLIQPIIGLWLLVLVASRSRPSPLSGVFRTPHDWIMFAYLGYIVLFAGGSVMEVLPLLSFYVLTVQSITSWPRLFSYLKYWNGALAAIAGIAVASTVGLDLTGAQDLYNTRLGRLGIGTWLHSNPNALAHSVVVVIPLSYVLFFWRGSASNRFVLFPALSGLAFYCAWLTQSKGAFLVGGALVVLIFVVGRPKLVQIFVIAAALLVGISALSFLPRMGEMNNLRADEGVQGRLLAWEMARTASKQNETGVGWKEFIAYIPWKEGRQHMIVKKATHSSYVQVAADLGKYGLFLYLAGIWVAIHTLLALKSKNTLEERCRRALMMIVLAYVLSGWMINRQYHTEYFLLIAVTAAMHRIKKGDELELNSAENQDIDLATESPGQAGGTTAAFTKAKSLITDYFKPLWNQFGVIDLACCTFLTWFTFWMWDYILKNI